MADDDFAKAVSEQAPITTEEQKKAGAPIAGDIDEEHKNFLQTLTGLIDSGEIDPFVQQTFLKHEVYDGLDEGWKEKTDLTLINIANQIRSIDQYRSDPENPQESPQLQTMIESLWQMKQRIEEHHDVFKF